MHQTSRSSTFCRVALAGLLAISAAAAHGLTEYRRQQITQYLDSPKMNDDPTLFDGRQFVPEADPNTVAKYYNAYVDSLNRAIRGWKMLSSTDAGSEEGQALFARLQAKLDRAKAMQAAYPAFRAATSGPSGQAAPSQSSSAASGGGMSEYQKQSLTRYLDSDSMKRDADLFDGEAFVAGVPFPTIQRYYDGYMRSLGHALSAWERQIPSSARDG